MEAFSANMGEIQANRDSLIITLLAGAGYLAKVIEQGGNMC